VLRPTYDATDGVDGRVSIEVEPRLAHDSEQTVAEARQLWGSSTGPNLFIKIPATTAGGLQPDDRAGPGHRGPSTAGPDGPPEKVV
jgi:transaldolase